MWKEVVKNLWEVRTSQLHRWLHVAIVGLVVLGRAEVHGLCNGQTAGVGCHDLPKVRDPGDEEGQGSRSYVVSIRRPGVNRHVCSGIIADTEHVITAASCVDDSSVYSAGLKPLVVIGVARIDDEDQGIKRCKVMRTILHPKWLPCRNKRSPFNIAILQLQCTVKLPVPELLFDHVPVDTGDQVFVKGFGAGTIKIGKPIFTNLKDEPHELIGTSHCNKSNLWNGTLGEGLICSLTTDQKTSCVVDSGGPVILRDPSGESEFDYVIGINVDGEAEDCGRAGKPDIHVDFRYVYLWICTEIPSMQQRLPCSINQQGFPKTTRHMYGVDINTGLPMHDSVSIHYRGTNAVLIGTTSLLVVLLMFHCSTYIPQHNGVRNFVLTLQQRNMIMSSNTVLPEQKTQQTKKQIGSRCNVLSASLRPQSQPQSLDWNLQVSLSDRTSDILGYGAFGYVQRGSLYVYDASSNSCSEIQVAVKISHDQANYDAHQALIREAAMLVQVGWHPNIVRCYGGKKVNEKLKYIVEECMDASLEKYVHQMTEEPIAWDVLLSIFHGIAAGLQQMHNIGPSPIVHQDLSTHNILLKLDKDQIKSAKIADFGCCKIKMNHYLSSAIPGKRQYWAPEVWSTVYDHETKQQLGGSWSRSLHGTSVKTKVSEKCDIYSFGVVMWECIEKIQPQCIVSFTVMHSTPNEASTGEHLTQFVFKREFPPQLADLPFLIQECLAIDPHQRPCANVIVNKIAELRESLN